MMSYPKENQLNKANPNGDLDHAMGLIELEMEFGKDLRKEGKNMAWG